MFVDFFYSVECLIYFIINDNFSIWPKSYWVKGKNLLNFAFAPCTFNNNISSNLYIKVNKQVMCLSIYLYNEIVFFTQI